MKLPTLVARVLRAVLGPDGHSSQQLRAAAAQRAVALCSAEPSDTPIEGALAAYVDKVALTPYKVSDSDIAALRGAGFSEDQIFELTVATALGSARARFEKTLELTREDAS